MLTPREIRQCLLQRLQTDAELDAFCLDYFPQVYNRFSNGMDRVTKMNLLLQVSDPEAILRCLEPGPREKGPVPRQKSPRPQRIGFLTLCGIALAGSIGIVVNWHNPASRADSNLLIIETNPAGSEVIIDGEVAGYTPWSVPPHVALPRAICVRKVGFSDSQLTISNTQRPRLMINLRPAAQADAQFAQDCPIKLPVHP